MKSFILKYKWWFSFVCCALLVACEPASTTSTQNPISFGAGRKNSAYNSNLSNDNTNAYLWGYRTNNSQTETIFNRVLARLYDADNTNTSIYDDIEIQDDAKYWNIGTYNFFSVSPKLTNASITPDNTTLIITDFDIATQADVIAAVPDTITVSGLEYNTPVQLKYTHLLSKIKFKAQTTQNTCTITNFTITIHKTATYTHTTGSEENPTTGAWDTKTETETCILSLPENYTPTINSADETLLDLDGTDGTNDNGWLIFPGTVIADNETTADVNEGIAYSITYTVGNNSQNQTGTLPPLTNGGLANNSYIYTLKIQPSGPIIFGEVTIVNWEEDETNSKDYPFDITP